MWQVLWPERPVEAVPITHVTNGVHLNDLDRTADAPVAGPPPR
jgi:hypothetical protein